MMIKAIHLAIAASAMTWPVWAQTPPPPPPPEAKTQALAYVTAAGKSDLYEINSSQIALQKSRDPQVHKFAEMLIKHHRMTTAATVKAAQKAGLTPLPPALDAGATASLAELQKASGADFDRIYWAQQVPAHRAALDLHQSFASSGEQAPLRTSARSAVPIVKQHLDAATKMLSGGSRHGI